MSAIPSAVREEVEDRSAGFCEAGVTGVCTYTASHMHHVVLRSRGGEHDPLNIKHVCRRCHDWVHANPILATRLGLMASNRTGDTE